MPRGSRLLVVGLAAALASAAVSAAAANPSAKALYKALLVGRLSPAELPAGFSSLRISAKAPGPNPKRHHVVGEVEIDFNQGRARIVYVIFPTRTDALGNHADGVRELKIEKGITSVRTSLPGLPRPSVVVDASVNGLGVTQVSFVAGNVEAAAQTVESGSNHGDVAGTLRLAKLALGHLRAVERHVSS